MWDYFHGIKAENQAFEGRKCEKFFHLTYRSFLVIKQQPSRKVLNGILSAEFTCLEKIFEKSGLAIKPSFLQGLLKGLLKLLKKVSRKGCVYIITELYRVYNLKLDKVIVALIIQLVIIWIIFDDIKGYMMLNSS